MRRIKDGRRSRNAVVRVLAAAAVFAAGLAFAVPTSLTSAAPPNPPGKLPTSSANTSFAAGSYIIDLGASTSAAGVQAKPNGLRPYGLVYNLLVEQKIPVYWVIADGKAGGNAILTPGTASADFSAFVQVDRVGPTNVSKTYKSGAFVVPAEFVTPAVTALVNNATFGSTTIVDVANQPFDAPVFDKISYWPRAVLDAQNGALAVPFYTNAGIPASSSSYVFKAPSQLNSCDDVYVMPHADPTWAVHNNLLNFNNQGGYIWGACHAPSVLEAIVNPANPAQRLNFLSNNGLVNYKNHAAGTPPYEYSSDGSDPVMQFIGRLDSATQNGSEQIFVPLPGAAPNGGWRPTTKNIVWDPTQVNVPGVTGEAGTDQARVLTYGRGFGNETNGLVQYLGGHSANKGTVGDVAAQRSYFNFVLLAGIERRPEVEMNVPEPVGAGAPSPVSATVEGGSPAYSYEWFSSCGGSFAQKTGVLTTSGGTIATTFTPPDVAVDTPCNIRLEISDNCQRVVIGAESTVVTPVADLSIEKTADDDIIANGDPLTYTLTVRNNGPGEAENVVVTDTLPFGLAFDGANPVPDGNDGNEYTWNLGDLADGAEVVITIDVTALVGGAVAVNRATVTSDTPDPDLSNNQAEVSTILINSGIEIEKIARPELLPSAGGEVVYEYFVRNTGNAPLSDVVVEDNPSCTIVWDPTTDLNGNGLLDPPLDGFPTEIWRYSCTKFVDASTPDVDSDVDGFFIQATSITPGTKQNVVRVTAVDAEGDDVAGWATATVTVAEPSIAVTKALTPAGQQPAAGGNATFTITVTNNGNVPLTDISTTDIWAGTCSVGSIPNLDLGQSYSYTCNATVPAGAQVIENWDVPPTPSNPESYEGGSGWIGSWTETGETTNPTAGTVLVNAGTAAPTLPSGYSTPNVLRMSTASGTKSIQRDVNLAGGPATLTFLYHRTNQFNNNNETLTIEAWTGADWEFVGSIGTSGQNLFDPAWSTFSAEIPQDARVANSRLRFTVTGGNANRQISLDNITIVRSVINEITVNATDLFGEPVAATDTEPVTLGTPGLSLTKTANPAAVRDGDTLTYTVTATNTGSVTQTGVVLTDPMPSGLNLVSASGTLLGKTATENWTSRSRPRTRPPIRAALAGSATGSTTRTTTRLLAATWSSTRVHSRPDTQVPTSWSTGVTRPTGCAAAWTCRGPPRPPSPSPTTGHRSSTPATATSTSNCAWTTRPASRSARSLPPASMLLTPDGRPFPGPERRTWPPTRSFASATGPT